METSFKNYAKFCEEIGRESLKSFFDFWEKWDKNQALFEYLIQDTQADTEARMRPYKVLYYMLYPDKLPPHPYSFGIFYALLPQFDKKMLADLMYNYFLSTKHFYSWGIPYFSHSLICRDTAFLLADAFVPLIYKVLDNSNLAPLPSEDWRFNKSEFKYRYADYAHSFLCMILRIEYPDTSMCLSYEERLPEIIKMKSIVQAYCAEKGISLE